MGVFQNFFDVIRYNPDDDDDDDYDYDNEMYDDDDLDDLDDEDFEERPKKPSRKERKAAKEAEREEKAAAKAAAVKNEKPAKSGKITPITKTSRKQSVEMEVCVIKPLNMDDESEIADTLLSGTTVVLNLEGLQIDVAQRIIDFCCGATYAMGGSLRKVSTYIFVATPSGVDISGDISDFMESMDISL